MTPCTKHTSSFARLILTGVFMLLGFLTAHATSVKFDIPAQAAPAALDLFGKQAKVSVAYSLDDLKDVTAHAVSGTYEPAAALDLLLQDTGFTAKPKGRDGFVVTKAKAVVTTGSVKGALTGEGGKGVANVLVSIRETSQSAETDRYGQYAFPNVAAGTYVLVASATGYQTLHITDVNVQAGRELILGKEEMRKAGEGPVALEPFVVHAETIEQLEKIEVVGTRQQPFSGRNVDLPRTINDVQPYYIFDSQKIEESGTNSVEDFLRQRLTMETTVQTNSQKSLYTVNGGVTISPVAPGSTTSTASSINLNGLGADHTLILVNGRPMPRVAVFNSGVVTPGQPDVNGIPLGAIDRIEVLPSSAGAIYGAGASGGVINIVLKRAYNGGEISATYGGTWDGHGPSNIFAAAFGTSFNRGKTQLLLVAQYSDQSPLFVQDRLSLYDRGFNAILSRDPGFFGANALNSNGTGTPFLGAEPNFRARTAGQTLTFKSTGASFGSSYGTVPVGFTASSDPNSLIPGKWNLTPGASDLAPNGLRLPLGSYPRRKSVMGTLTHDLTDKLQLHADYSYNENHSFTTYDSVGLITVRAVAPINPFNQDLSFQIPVYNPGPATANSLTNAVTFGGTLKLPFNWVAHVDYQWGQSTFEYYHTLVNSNAFSGPSTTPTFGTPNGVNDPNLTPISAGVINPFTDTLANPIDWRPFTNFYSGKSKSTSNDLIVAASGPFAHFPWGDPTLSVRLEHNRSDQPDGNVAKQGPVSTPYLGLPGAGNSVFTSLAQAQTINSANAELDLPVFKTKLPLLRALDLQFNVSTQQATVSVGTPGYLTVSDYPYPGNSVAGTSQGPAGAYILAPNTLSPSVTQAISSGAQPYRSKAKFSGNSTTGPALSYKPFDDIIIRASVANGYVPPTYSQLLPTNYLQVPSITTITDPKNGGARYSVTSYSLGGNAGLNPTTSKSWDFGIVWQPSKGLFKGLRLDAEFVETKQFNQILDPGVQGFINFENLFPGHVVRDPTSGMITTVFDQFVNVAQAKQSAWTFTADYAWKTPIGSFDFTAAETIQEHNQQQIQTGIPFLEYAGFPNSGGVAKNKATGTLRWACRNWVVAWTAVYIGGYKQSGAHGDPLIEQYALEGLFTDAQLYGPLYSNFNSYVVAQGSETVPSQTYHSLYLSYAFPKSEASTSSRMGRWAHSLLTGVTVSLVVNNVFNTLPPLDAYYAPFYTSPYGDLQLRNYAITLKKSF